MSKLCILLAFASTVAYVYAAVAIYPYEPKPAEFADQEGCYIRNLGRVLPYNEPYYPRDGKSCVQYTCRNDNTTQLVSCGAVGLPPECRLVKDLTLDYPDCCGKPVCDPTTTTESPSADPNQPGEVSESHPTCALAAGSK